MELKTTKYSVDGAVATLTLSRPHRRNAWTGRMHTEVRWVLEQAEQHPQVRVVVITGEGRDFCVGADAQALEGHTSKGGYDAGTTADLAMPGYGIVPEFDQHFAFMMALDTVTVAAVNGAAAGVGLVLACYCDLRFAASGAKLTTAHGPLGLPAEYGLSWVLPRLVGITRSNDLLLSSRKFLACDTEGWGLFNEIVDAGRLLDRVYEYARDMAARVAPSSLATTKRQIYLDQHRDVGTAVAESDRLLREMIPSPDYREGVRALTERRLPQWPPR
ncbi:enoyl-CoA hydratase-related protein [Candidatus Poriferisodalis sp.]|uniref:enoyl-CoA hydratase-related protein n=1 Tax=Candidatus Poriferisodalis sp. TaxID=3101277 RepID=UPI003B02C1F0